MVPLRLAAVPPEAPLAVRASDSLFLAAPPPLDVTVDLVSPTCLGSADGQIAFEDSLGTLTPYVYQLNGGGFGTQPVFGNLSAGAYEIAVQDANGCEYDQTVTVTDGPELLLELGPDTTIHLGDSIRLTAFTNAASDSLVWTWTPQELLSCDACSHPWARPVETTVFGLRVEGPNGCSNEAFQRIRVVRDTRVFVPNGFSPNGDGSNDVVFVQASNEVARVLNFQIFDRWGTQLFTAQNFLPNDPTVGWDGTLRGRPMDPGVFVYYVDVELVDGTRTVISGDVALLR